MAESLPPCQESLGGVSVRRSRSRSLSSAESTRRSGSKDERRDPDGYTSITCTRGSISESCAIACLHRSGLLLLLLLFFFLLFFLQANVSAASSRTQIRLGQINHFSPSPPFRGVIAALRIALTPYGRGRRPMAARGAEGGGGARRIIGSAGTSSAYLSPPPVYIPCHRSRRESCGTAAERRRCRWLQWGRNKLPPRTTSWSV